MAEQTQAACPEDVTALVDRFDRNRDEYRSPAYNETQARVEFIDPLFYALGWDVHNKQGIAEAYKEVIHEDAIKVGGATKAPDYCFRVGPKRLFFVEAKKPARDVETDKSLAYQLRRYGWSAKLPLSILTDFEEFAVYDCRVRPGQADAASTARTMYFRYTDYADAWGDISAIFSREAAWQGSFDRYAESAKKKRGTAEVDGEFLKEIERWRDLLARNIALRNPGLSQRELNFAVGRTIDRIIFLRMCEDRGIEHYGSLQDLLNGANVYARLGSIYRHADDRYNSGLFHFREEKGRAEEPDTLTPDLAIDDKALKDIFKALYYPDSPYEFSVLPADILGQVYEQFLGKVIRLTPGHRAVVEDKPEVKKAGGVYYTPTYIVDYIVEHTVGKLLEDRTPREVAGIGGGKRPLRVLDPACGSGSFLIGAYQRLLDWHQKWYTDNVVPLLQAGKKRTSRDVTSLLPRRSGERKAGLPIYETKGGEWRLTTAERKRILLTHIYGVDIDAQAVEVTKLSLLLKVLEGESGESLDRQSRLIHERALPDLSSNVKCGNSLIGTDFYTTGQMRLFGDEERYRINAFDWDVEFPEVFAGKSPGFDAVIGNPPYIRMEMFKDVKPYLRERYACHAERTDLYAYFVERAHALLRRGGRFGMIISNKFLRANYGAPLRHFLGNAATVRRITDFAGLPVFPRATVRTVVLLTSKGRDRRILAQYHAPLPSDAFSTLASGGSSVEAALMPPTVTLPQDSFASRPWDLRSAHQTALIDKIVRASTPLSDYAGTGVCMGVKSGLVGAFVICAEQRDQMVATNPEALAILKPFIQGRDVRRYGLRSRALFLVYTFHGIDMRPYPAVTDHLAQYKAELEKRATKQPWYELQQPQLSFAAAMAAPKIVFPDIATHCRFALDRNGHFGANTVYFLPCDDLHLLGMLNSRLGQFYFRSMCAALEGPGEHYLRFFRQYIDPFPIPQMQVTGREHADVTEGLASLADRMSDLTSRCQRCSLPHDKKLIQQEIDRTDREIDQLVYELYGLTDDEIRIVEEATAPKARKSEV